MRVSDNGCYSGAQAYAQYSKLDKAMDTNMQIYSRKYKELAYTSAVLSTIGSGKFVTAIGSTKFILNLDVNNNQGLILYKLGW